MTDSIDHDGLTPTLITVLANAHASNSLGDANMHGRAIDLAARGIAAVFTHEPIRLPRMVSDLAARSPAVLRGDLDSAIQIVAADLLHRTGTVSPVLHIDTQGWILETAAERSTDPEAVTAWCCVDVGDDLEPVRAGDLPISDQLRQVLDRSEYPAIRAALDVRRRYDAARAERAHAADELHALLAPTRSFERRIPVGDAVAELHGPARVRAEEILAGLPSIAARCVTP